MALTGKVAIVTGASSGIGQAIALEFGRQGARVVANYRSQQEAAEAVASEIERLGGEAFAIGGSIANVDDVNTIVQKTLDRFGRVDVLVNNAGIERFAPFLEKSEEDWDDVIAINLKGPFLCTQAVARVMVRMGLAGTILNISSVHEDLAFPGYADYCAAKGGLRMLCRDLALELAPYGINVINISPGAIDTPINRATLEDPVKKQELLKTIPLGRVGSAGEVASLAAYLASDAARYITGTTVFIDGGLIRQAGSL